MVLGVAGCMRQTPETAIHNYFKEIKKTVTLTLNLKVDSEQSLAVVEKFFENFSYEIAGIQEDGEDKAFATLKIHNIDTGTAVKNTLTEYFAFALTTIFHPLSDEEMTYLLKRTARAEGKKLTPEVVNAIIEQADGGSRKALKLLAKVLYLDSEDEQLEVLSAGVDGENSETIELCRCLLSQGCNWAKLAQVIKDLDLSEPERIRQAVMGYMNAVLLKGKMNQNAVCALQAFSQADTYRNGKFAITVACIDALGLMS